MPPIDFPASPSPGQIYTFGSRGWRWNERGWESVNAPFVIVVRNIDGGTPGAEYDGIDTIDGGTLL